MEINIYTFLKNSFWSILLLFFFQSCSSLFYSENKRIRNNTIVIRSNQNNFVACFPKYPIEKNIPFCIENPDSIYLGKLKRKVTFVTLKSKDCYDTTVKIRRVPRVTAILLDLPLSVFYGIPYAIDIFRPDFYKIGRNYRELNISFQKTNEYFEKKIVLAKENNDSSTLNFLLAENPPKEIIDKINDSKKIIYETLFYRTIKQIKRDGNKDYEEFLVINKQIKNPSKKYRSILDSIAFSIEMAEIQSINEKKDLIRLNELSKIALNPFKEKLLSIKPSIETVVIDSLKKGFDFEYLNELISSSEESEFAKYNSLKNDLERSLINLAKEKNDAQFISKFLGMVSAPTKEKLQELQIEIFKNNKLALLKQDIEYIESQLIFKNYSELLEFINKIYPNSFSQTEPVNLRLKDLKRLIEEENNKEIIKIAIQEIKENLDNNELPLDKIERLANNPFLTFEQKEYLENSKRYCLANKKQQSLNSKKVTEEKDFAATFAPFLLLKALAGDMPEKSNNNKGNNASCKCKWCSKSFSARKRNWGDDILYEFYAPMEKLFWFGESEYNPKNKYICDDYCSPKCESEAKEHGR